jgi:hypothetical protein
MYQTTVTPLPGKTIIAATITKTSTNQNKAITTQVGSLIVTETPSKIHAQLFIGDKQYKGSNPFNVKLAIHNAIEINKDASVNKICFTDWLLDKVFKELNEQNQAPNETDTLDLFYVIRHHYFS